MESGKSSWSKYLEGRWKTIALFGAFSICCNLLFVSLPIYLADGIGRLDLIDFTESFKVAVVAVVVPLIVFVWHDGEDKKLARLLQGYERIIFSHTRTQMVREIENPYSVQWSDRDDDCASGEVE